MIILIQDFFHFFQVIKGKTAIIQSEIIYVQKSQCKKQLFQGRKMKYHCVFSDDLCISSLRVHSLEIILFSLF
jgi:hypothetical protein